MFVGLSGPSAYHGPSQVSSPLPSLSSSLSPTPSQIRPRPRPSLSIHIPSPPPSFQRPHLASLSAPNNCPSTPTSTIYDDDVDRVVVVTQPADTKYVALRLPQKSQSKQVMVFKAGKIRDVIASIHAIIGDQHVIEFTTEGNRYTT